LSPSRLLWTLCLLSLADMRPPTIREPAKAFFPQFAQDGGPQIVVGLPAEMVFLGGFLEFIRAV
jgi:hypothetical protein